MTRRSAAFKWFLLCLSLATAASVFSQDFCLKGLVYNPEKLKEELTASAYIDIPYFKTMMAIELRQKGNKNSVFLKGFVTQLIGDQFLFNDLISGRERIFDVNDLIYSNVHKFYNFEEWNRFGLDVGQEVLFEDGDVLRFKLKSAPFYDEYELVSMQGDLVTVIVDEKKKIININEIELSSLIVVKNNPQNPALGYHLKVGPGIDDDVSVEQLMHVYSMMHFIRHSLDLSIDLSFQKALQLGIDYVFLEDSMSLELFQQLGLLDDGFSFFPYVEKIARASYTTPGGTSFVGIKEKKVAVGGLVGLKLPHVIKGDESFEAWKSLIEKSEVSLDVYRRSSPKVISKDKSAMIAATDLIFVIQLLIDYRNEGLLEKLKKQLELKQNSNNSLFEFGDEFRGVGTAFDFRGIADSNGYIEADVLKVLNLLLLDAPKDKSVDLEERLENVFPGFFK